MSGLFGTPDEPQDAVPGLESQQPAIHPGIRAQPEHYRNQTQFGPRNVASIPDYSGTGQFSPPADGQAEPEIQDEIPAAYPSSGYGDPELVGGNPGYGNYSGYGPDPMFREDGSLYAPPTQRKRGLRRLFGQSPRD